MIDADWTEMTDESEFIATEKCNLSLHAKIKITQHIIVSQK